MGGRLVPDALVSSLRGSFAGMRIPCLQGASVQKLEASKAN